MPSADLAEIVRIIQERTGISFDEDRTRKILLPRINNLVRQHAMASIQEAAEVFAREPDGQFATELIDRIVVHESLFFRDLKLFTTLREEVFPALLEEGAADRTLRIWSCACAHGQEPYSLAMLWQELGPETEGWSLEILASDISHAALERAASGLYSQFEVQRGLPILSLIRCFEQIGDKWQIARTFRDQVEFRQFNLLDDFSDLGPFDLVLCRNVLLYLDRDHKVDILGRLSHVLRPGGCLVLGGSESLLGLVDGFSPHPRCGGLFSRETATSKQKSARAPAR